MTQALVFNTPAAIAVSLTAMMAFSRPAPSLSATIIPVWVPWAFLIILGLASCWLALTYPDLLSQPDPMM